MQTGYQQEIGNELHAFMPVWVLFTVPFRLLYNRFQQISVGISIEGILERDSE